MTDVVTKPLKRSAFCYLRSMLGVVDCEETSLIGENVGE